MSTAFNWGTIALALVVAGAGTYLLRLSVILFIGRVSGFSSRVSSTLAFVPPAVLATLAVATLVTFSPAPTPVFVFEQREAVAGVVGVLVAWRTRNVLATIVVGMIALWMLQLVTA